MAPVAGGALVGETGSQALLQSKLSPEQCSRAYLSMTSAAELFYLRHLRSCAASACGCRGTASGRANGFLSEPGVYACLLAVVNSVFRTLMLCVHLLLALIGSLRQDLLFMTPVECLACFRIGSAESNFWRNGLLLVACGATICGQGKVVLQSTRQLSAACKVRALAMMAHALGLPSPAQCIVECERASVLMAGGPGSLGRESLLMICVIAAAVGWHHLAKASWRTLLAACVVRTMMRASMTAPLLAASGSSSSWCHCSLGLVILVSIASNRHTPKTLACRCLSSLCVWGVGFGVGWRALAFITPSFPRGDDGAHVEASRLDSGSGGGLQCEGSGATELSLDAIISLLAENANPEAEKITTRARELRDARGRDRKPVVSRVAALFDHIHLREKLDGKWKTRKVADVEADVQKALSNAAKECLAGLRRQARPAEEEQSATAASSAASAAEHAGNAASSGGLRRPSELTSESSAAKKPRVTLPKRTRKRTERPAAPEEAEPDDEEEEEDGRQHGKKSRCVSDLFANPSSEESAALSWLREHCDEERAKEISEQIRSWSAKLSKTRKKKLGEKPWHQDGPASFK